MRSTHVASAPFLVLFLFLFLILGLPLPLRATTLPAVTNTPPPRSPRLPRPR